MPSYLSKALYVGGSSLVAGIVSEMAGHDSVTAAQAAQNAAQNNYLKHLEALEYEMLLTQKRNGTCGSVCQARMLQLDRLDRERNETLAGCVGVDSAVCVAARQEVQAAMAEYLLSPQNVSKATDRLYGLRYINERYETQQYADLAIGRTLGGKASGLLGSFGDFAVELGKKAVIYGGTMLWTFINPVFAKEVFYPFAAYQMQQDAFGLAQTFSSQENFASALGFTLTAAERQVLADAYLSGNAQLINEIYGAQTVKFTLTVGGAAYGATKLSSLEVKAGSSGVLTDVANAINESKFAQLWADFAGVSKGGETALSQGFNSFSSFKRAYGSAGEGYQWHHIVEQTPGNLAQFGNQAIHNTENLVKLPTDVHWQISGYYSSKQGFSQPLTVREWLSSKPIQGQYDFGVKVMEQFGVTKP
jgi:hypothetical protein